MSVFAGGVEAAKSWRVLSARSQNLHNQLLLFNRDSEPDPSVHEESLKGIEDALNDLVKIGELESKPIQLKPPSDTDHDVFKKLFARVDLLSKEYGVFVASEMCGLGARLRFTSIDSDSPIKLHLRLPKKELQEFMKEVVKLDLLIEAEKIAPAETLKSEDDKK